MIFNFLTIFSWSTWLFICIALILVFWIVWGGKQEYEFVGVKPLQSPDLVELFHRDPKESLLESPENLLVNKQLKSKGEDIVADVFEDILKRKVERNIRPTFLRNPETGKCLELDCYDPEYKIAVEYNGIQHYEFPSAFHQTEEQFTNQIYRDRLKKKLCDENGVYLIPVPYWVDTCVPNPNDSDGEMICYTSVSKTLRYTRIYDYLKERLQEYFSLILPPEENQPNGESNEDDYESTDDMSDEWSEYSDER
jgi:hypothetical protein